MTSKISTKPKLWTRDLTADGMRYYTGPDDCPVPQSIPAGRLLVHNHIAHTIDMEHGLNGFRCWTFPKDKLSRGLKRCKCGWSGLPHYRARSDDKRIDALWDRCISQARLEQINSNVWRDG